MKDRQNDNVLPFQTQVNTVWKPPRNDPAHTVVNHCVEFWPVGRTRNASLDLCYELGAKTEALGLVPGRSLNELFACFATKPD